MKRILLLDDEVNVLHALQRSLRQDFPGADVHIEIFTDVEQALLRCGEVAFNVIVSDYRMPGMNGVDFLRTAKAIQPGAIRLLLSASTEFETVLQAVNQAEVYRYIAKPWKPEDLRRTLVEALAYHAQSIEDRRLADELRLKRGELTPQELEARRLEAEEPGITKVKWGEDGSVQLH